MKNLDNWSKHWYEYNRGERRWNLFILPETTTLAAVRSGRSDLLVFSADRRKKGTARQIDRDRKKGKDRENIRKKKVKKKIVKKESKKEI